MLQYGPLKADVVLQPVSGKALPVLRGEALRIIQEEGEQCVDFNAFNLHDYKEYLGISNTRSRNAFRVKKGDIIWSVSSRDRPMFLILEISETCRPTCSEAAVEQVSLIEGGTDYIPIVRTPCPPPSGSMTLRLMMSTTR